MDLTNLTSWIPSAVVLLAVFLGKNWIKAGIEKGVQHKFDEKLEKLRADLRDKEDEITTLRNAVVGGSANRQALVEKRRLEAVERVWEAVNLLAPFKVVSAQMAIIKFDAASEEVSTNPTLRRFFETITKTIPEDKIAENPAKNEQLFVSPIAWAYFSAYQAIVYTAFIKAKLLQFGIKDGAKLVNSEHAVNLLKTALPDMKDFIEEHKADSSVFHYLLDALEERLLIELQRMLRGEDADQASIDQSIKIMKAVEQIKAASAEATNTGRV